MNPTRNEAADDSKERSGGVKAERRSTDLRRLEENNLLRSELDAVEAELAALTAALSGAGRAYVFCWTARLISAQSG